MKKSYMIIITGFCVELLTGVAAYAQQSESGRVDTVTYREKYRPQYHLTPKSGGLIDPTDLIYVDGKYQANKRLAVSADLLHWQVSPRTRLSNERESEMSGSTVLDVNNSSGFGINGKPPLVAIYSGLRISDRRQYQCLAYSNDEGRTWSQYDRNPVIDIGSTEFRDPQVFWHQESKKWVMAVALAAERKISFYGSTNLKEWNHLSDFGPFGAQNGVWECPDIFRLPVDGDPGKQKWVLTVSVQPLGGQYFIGEFDGTSFSADEKFLADLRRMKKNQNTVPGKLLFGFENGISDWQIEGNAFSQSPAKGSLAGQNPVFGFMGDYFINSFDSGDQGTGKITSPAFTITDRFLNFLVGGGEFSQALQVNLKIGNRIVRTATGTNAEVLTWTGWNVEPYRGQKGVIEIIDSGTDGFKHIMADHFILSPQLASSEWEKAFWVDYGPDFYAVRSWVNGPANNDRRVWVAWLGSWLYASSVPSSPWRGGHTFPRSVTLQHRPEGIRLIQNPIEEIRELRGKPFSLKPVPVKGMLPLPQLSSFGNTYELVTELELGPAAKAGLIVAKGTHMQTVISYDRTTGTLRIDRRHSGNVSFSKAFPKTYSAPVKLQNNRLKLHVLIDKSTLEVFVNDGRTVMTCLLYPDEAASAASLFSTRGTVRVVSLEAWKLKSIW